jgi:hypothetical protein
MEEIPDIGEFPENSNRSPAETEELLRMLWERVRENTTIINGMGAFAASQTELSKVTTSALESNQELVRVLAEAINEIRRKLGEDDLPPVDWTRGSVN